MTCESDRISHVGQKNIKLSCVLTAIPFVAAKRIRVQYVEAGKSNRNIKVRIAPGRTEDKRYKLSSHKVSF